jgi:hypothetical protein
MYAFDEGMAEHPEWYPDLNPVASYSAVQSVLHENPKLSCTKPCPCYTAVMGDDCHSSIKWVLKEGIEAHPTWYQGLTKTSSFDQIQARLHEDPNSTCLAPCPRKEWGSPSLFCWSIFRSQGYETELVSQQVAKGVGIFACDEFASLSDANLTLGKGVHTILIPPCETVGVSKDGTAANTMIFMNAWDKIHEDLRYRSHDWIIKADPDAVLIPDRLRSHLQPHTGQSVFILNCNKFSLAMMFGALEAISRQALDAYYAGQERCKTELQWQAWGEDLYMGTCLKHLGVQAVGDYSIVGDNLCSGANCGDGTSAAYHPFKNIAQWLQCHDQATAR